MEEVAEKHELFAAWFPLKERKHNIDTRKIPKITEGEVWWVAVGETGG